MPLEFWSRHLDTAVPWTSGLLRKGYLGSIDSKLLTAVTALLIGGIQCTMGFLSGSDSIEFTCNAGDLGSIPGSGRAPGGGHGYPLQYFCLENSMDRGAWWATVHGVAKSRRRLSTHTLYQVPYSLIYLETCPATSRRNTIVSLTIHRGNQRG